MSFYLLFRDSYRISLSPCFFSISRKRISREDQIINVSLFRFCTNICFFSFLFFLIRLLDFRRNFLVQKFICADWVIFFSFSLLWTARKINERACYARSTFFFSFFYIFFIRIVLARFSPRGFVNKSRTRRIILRENLKRLSRQKVFEHRPRISHFFPRGEEKGNAQLRI